MDKQQLINISIEIPDVKDHVILRLETINKEVSIVTTVDGIPDKEFKSGSNELKVELKGTPDKEILNSISIYEAENDERVFIGQVEFIKQSEEYLKSRFNFSMKNGYLVLNRCTFNLSQPPDPFDNSEESIMIAGEQEKERIMELFEKIDPEYSKLFGETIHPLTKADIITKYIWRIFSDSGPSDLIDGKKLGLFERLNIIHTEGGTVQCSGTRDLFIELFSLFEPEVKSRKCDVFRYYPPIKNLVVNSHSLLELFIDEKWVAYDPFVRVYFTNKQDDLLSIEQIFKARKDNTLKDIEVTHIETVVEKRQDFNPENNPFDPYGYNYFSTFGYIKYTRLNLILYEELLANTENCIEEGNYNDASANISFVLDRNERDLNMLNDLSVILILSNNLDEAVLKLNYILTIDPENETAKENLKYIADIQSSDKS